MVTQCQNWGANVSIEENLYFTSGYRGFPPYTLSQHPDNREIGDSNVLGPLCPWQCFLSGARNEANKPTVKAQRPTQQCSRSFIEKTVNCSQNLFRISVLLSVYYIPSLQYYSLSKGYVAIRGNVKILPKDISSLGHWFPRILVP